MNPGVRLVQLSRLFGIPIRDDETARAAIATHPGDFARALFHEAADSDDVTSVPSAMSYLEDRLLFFDSLIPDGVGESIRLAYREYLRAWE